MSLGHQRCEFKKYMIKYKKWVKDDAFEAKSHMHT